MKAEYMVLGVAFDRGKRKGLDRLLDALWETYSSFDNSSGGCIILGMKEKDDKSWITTGLKDSLKMKKKFFDALHNPNKVNVSLASGSDVSG